MLSTTQAEMYELAVVRRLPIKSRQIIVGAIGLAKGPNSVQSNLAVDTFVVSEVQYMAIGPTFVNVVEPFPEWLPMQRQHLVGQIASLDREIGEEVRANVALTAERPWDL